MLHNSGKITKEQRQAFERWLTQSPAHRKAWKQTQLTWQGLEQLTPIDLQDLKNAVLPPPGSPRRGFFTVQRYAFSALVIVLTALIYQQPFWYADYTTNVGETKKIILSDGSAVELDTNSAISVDFTKNHRRIVLHQGEAFFTVAADVTRPFDVIAGEADVQALGTAFDVSRDGENMQVTVFEHAVRVSAGKQRIDKLSRGNSVSFKDQCLGNITPQNLETIDSWRQQSLIFEDRRLGEVIKALNRYRHIPVVILGSNVKNLSVTGLFDTEDTNSALQAIEETLAC